MGNTTNLEQFNDVQLNLEILVEEMAEVIQLKSKIARFGLHDKHEGVSNHKKLKREIADVLAMVDILKYNGLITNEEIEIGKRLKLEKLKKWY